MALLKTAPYILASIGNFITYNIITFSDNRDAFYRLLVTNKLLLWSLYDPISVIDYKNM